MREIKFMAWDKFKNEMFDPMPIVDFKIYQINAIELMQFTGRKDKNGKDIYEGYQCFAKFKTKLGVAIVGGEIIMDEYMWCLKDTMGKTDEIYSINRLHDFQVIGNIYQGLYLLNSEQGKHQNYDTL